MTVYARAVVAGDLVAGRLVRLACERHLRDLSRMGRADWPYRFDAGAADRVLRFFPEVLRFYDGALAGEPFTLAPWQAFVVGSLFGWVSVATGARRFRQAYIEAGKGSGKALALDTPIPTPSGWTTMGALRVGDEAFDESGRPARVLFATEPMFDHPCYRVEFSDGDAIVADAEHLWWTTALRSGGPHGPKPAHLPRKGRPALRTTAEIATTLSPRPSTSRHPQAKWNHRIEVAGPLALPERPLPIDPYALGVWLGDGHSDAARLTCGALDLDEMLSELAVADVRGVVTRRDPRSTAVTVRLTVPRPADGRCDRGHPPAERNRRGRCLACARATDQALRQGMSLGRAFTQTFQGQLRAVGLLTQKHIPSAYLRASAAQRLALLQGLMDTDGSCNRAGYCEFSTTNATLADGAMELLRTLGYKPTRVEARARLRGRDCGSVYRIQFRAYRDEAPVFRLSRKVARLPERPPTHPISRGRMIVGCSPVPSVPVRCIKIDSPSGLFLAGRGMIPTHNTPLLAGLGLYGLVCDDEPGAQVVTAAVTREQARLLYDDAKHLAEVSPLLSAELEIGEQQLIHRPSLSTLKPVSSEGRSLDGKRVHLALIDEVHEHRTDVVVNKLVLGLKGRREPLAIEITNSGVERSSVCWLHHDLSRRILEGLEANETWFAYVCGLDPCEPCHARGLDMPQEGCPACDNWRDEATWPKANPGLPVAPSLDYLRDRVQQATQIPSQQNLVRRLNFCTWTQAYTRWFTAEQWAQGSAPVDTEALKGRPCIAGLDLSSTTDLTGVVLVFPDEDFVVEGPPEGEGAPPEAAAAGDGEAAAPALVVQGGVDVLAWAFCPEDGIVQRSRVDRVPYAHWRDAGALEATPGNVIDYRRLRARLLALREAGYDIQEVCYDPAFATQLALQLQDEDGFTAVAVPQGFASLNEPSMLLETLVLRGALRHGGHPALAWCAGNVVCDRDSGGRIRPSKRASTERIDLVTALVTALKRLGAVRGGTSVYDRRPLLVV